MAKQRFPSNGSGTFSDGLVGNQKTSTNDFTQSNFSTDGTPVVRDTRSFTTSEFSNPISLDDLNTPENLEKINTLFDQSLKIKFNTEKGSKDLFGSALLRAKAAVVNAVNKFPASLYVTKTTPQATTVNTAYDVVYDGQFNTTEFKIPYQAIRNPLGIEYTKKGINYFDTNIDGDRNFSKEFEKYVVYYGGKEYKITEVVLLSDYGSGPLTITVEGNPFNGLDTLDDFYIKLNDLLFEKKFVEMDDFEQLLLDRESDPKYIAKFKLPIEDNDGNIYFGEEQVRWEMQDDLNIVVTGVKFERYLDRLFEICEVIDNYKANLIARFLTTASLHEFDTEGQKVKKVFQLYGRFFDDVKKFIDNIAYMNNVTYDKINNIPDLLLKNLAGLLGMDVITSINEKNVEEYLYKKKDSQFDGLTKGKTPFETDIEIYRRIILNAAYLYKSKGTRKPLRFLMNFVGAPESFIEINEYVYKVTNGIDYSKFKEEFDKVSDGDWFEDTLRFKSLKVWDENREDWFDRDTFVKNNPEVKVVIIGYLPAGVLVHDEEKHGEAYIEDDEYQVVEINKEGGIFNEDEYPIERVNGTDNSRPKRPTITNEYFFQKGAGWFERTDEHKSLSVLDDKNSDLNSSPKVIKTKFEDFTYGEKYFERYKTFPNFTDGWELRTEVDNKKSSPEEDSFILNRKNIDVFLNPGRAVLYDFVRTYQQHSLSYSSILLNNFNFAQFADYGFWQGIEVGKGKYGKKYWDLIELFKEYYEGGLGKAYDYEKTYSYLSKISTYWIRLVEQFIPATTLWFTGEKIDNHSLHRPKFNWVEPCRNDVTTLDLTLKKSLYEMLIDVLTKYKNIPDCYERQYKYANWYYQIKINGKVYTVDYHDEWNHFFTSTESTLMGTCNNENSGPGTVDECESFDNPINMLCDFETFIQCYPDECEDFVATIIGKLEQISVTIFDEDIKENLTDIKVWDDFEQIWKSEFIFTEEHPNVDVKTPTVVIPKNPSHGDAVILNNCDVENGKAFEIEGYKGGENCYDCNEEIKLISNNYCGECFEIDTIEIGLQILVNEGEDKCTHKCFVLDDTPFSIDHSQFGGVQYDVNRPEHHIDPLDPRGTAFLTRRFSIENCCEEDKPYHGIFEYIGLMDPVDRYPVYKHVTEDIYLSAYPEVPESTQGSFMITQGPKESYTEIYGRIDNVSLLDFTNVFNHNEEWLIDNCITTNDMEEDQDVVRHRYAIGDEIGICDRVNDDGFDYIKLWLHGGTYEAQDGSTLPYDVVFDCKDDISEGEEIWYDVDGDVFIIKIKSGEDRLIHAYDQSGASIHILLKDRRTELVGIDFETETEYGSYSGYDGYGGYGSYVSYGGYGQYGSYSGYGGYFCYGNEYLYYSNINPYCVGVIEYEILPECQGYEIDTEFYRVIDPVNTPITQLSDVVIGENVEIVRVQDINQDDFIIVSTPEMGEIEYCDYSSFYYGDESVVCNYTDNVTMSQVTHTMCDRIYKFVNINDGRIKLEHDQNVLVMEDLLKTNSNDLLTLCGGESSKTPIGTILNMDGTFDTVYYDNEYQIISKPASQIKEGDYIVTTDECGVVLVESVEYDDYCDTTLFVDKYVIKYGSEFFAWYRPKEGYDTIYVNDQCVGCQLIECPCVDDIEITVDECVDDIETTVNECVDDIDYDVSTTTTTKLPCIDDIQFNVTNS